MHIRRGAPVAPERRLGVSSDRIEFTQVSVQLGFAHRQAPLSTLANPFLPSSRRRVIHPSSWVALATPNPRRHHLAKVVPM